MTIDWSPQIGALQRPLPIENSEWCFGDFRITENPGPTPRHSLRLFARRNPRRGHRRHGFLLDLGAYAGPLHTYLHPCGVSIIAPISIGDGSASRLRGCRHRRCRDCHPRSLFRRRKCNPAVQVSFSVQSAILARTPKNRGHCAAEKRSQVGGAGIAIVAGDWKCPCTGAVFTHPVPCRHCHHCGDLCTQTRNFRWSGRGIYRCRDCRRAIFLRSILADPIDARIAQSTRASVFARARNGNIGAAGFRVTRIVGARIRVVAIEFLSAAFSTRTHITRRAQAAIIAIVFVVAEVAIPGLQVAQFRGAGVPVVAFLRRATEALSVLACIAHRTEISVFARTRHILVCAATLRVTSVIGTGVVVVAGQLLALALALRTFVVDGAEISIIAKGGIREKRTPVFGRAGVVGARFASSQTLGVEEVHTPLSRHRLRCRHLHRHRRCHRAYSGTGTLRSVHHSPLATRVVIVFTGFGGSRALPIHAHIHQGAGIAIVARRSISQPSNVQPVAVSHWSSVHGLSSLHSTVLAPRRALGGASPLVGIVVVAGFPFVPLMDAFPIDANPQCRILVITLSASQGPLRRSLSRALLSTLRIGFRLRQSPLRPFRTRVPASPQPVPSTATIRDQHPSDQGKPR